MATDSALREYQHTAASTGEYLAAMDTGAAQAASLLAGYPGLIDGSWVSGEARQAFAEILVQNPLFYAVYIGFDNGDFYQLINLNVSSTVRDQLNAAPTDRWVVIEVRGEGDKRRRQFHYHDADFNLRVSRDEATDYDAAKRPWFVGAAEGRVGRTDPYQFQHLQAPGQTYSTRIEGGNAVLAVDIALSSISDYLRQPLANADSEIFLYKDSGEIIASSRSRESRYQIPASKPLSLSQTQRALIESKPLFTVANEIDWPPIDFAVSGEPQGYAIDVLGLIAEMTGLRFDFVNGLRWPELVALFENGQLDILQPVFGTTDNGAKGELTTAFLKVPYGVITTTGETQITHLQQLNGKVVAIPQGWSILPIVREHYPGITIVEVASVKGLFDAVRNGEADAGLDTAAILDYTMRQFFIGDIQLHQPLQLGQSPLPEQLHFLVHNRLAGVADIFNLALANISEEQQQVLRSKWLEAPRQLQQGMGTLPYLELKKLTVDAVNLDRLNRVAINGRDHFVYIQTLGGQGASPDYFAVVTPVASVLQPATEKVTRAIWITGACLLLLLPLSSWLAGFIVKPITRLADENRKISERNYGALTPVNSRIVEIENLATSLATMAKAIEQHAREQEALMEAFLTLIAQAIDDKSPYTAKHCARVPELAMMLARQAHQSQEKPFDGFSFDNDQQWREFRVGAWLHDCGKITSPERIIDKGTKLEANYNRIHEIRTRFEVLWRDAEIDYWRQRLAGERDEHELSADLDRRRQQLQEDFAFIADCNLGGENLDDSAVARLEQLSAIRWQRHFDDRLGLSPIEKGRLSGVAQSVPATERLLADKAEHIIPRVGGKKYPERFGIRMDIPEHLYNLGELYNLKIARGTLTTEDRFKINEHIISTIKMLDSLPFPEELAQVPRYATTHHETLDGTGYPRKLTAEDLSIPERIMVLADIFEALTAGDRPYKPAKPMSVAIDILHSMVQSNHVDAHVFELFLRSGAYLEFAQRFLPPEQIDEVDIDRYLS